MNPPDLVAEIGARLNLTGLTMNNGVCRLIFDRSLAIDIEDDSNGNLCFHTVLAPLPHENTSTLMKTLLSAHLFGLETDGAVFGLHPATNELYLFRSLPLEGIQVDSTLDALERFVQTTENWKQRIATVEQDTPVDADERVADSATVLRA